MATAKSTVESNDNTVEVDSFNPETGEIVLSDSTISNTIAALAEGRVNSNVFATIKGADFASRILVSKALTSSKPISEHLGKTINLREVVIQKGSMKNEQTGEMEDVARTVLIDEDGSAYHAMSKTLFRDITQNILAVVPDTSAWPSAIPVVVKKEGSGARQYFALYFA